MTNDVNNQMTASEPVFSEPTANLMPRLEDFLPEALLPFWQAVNTYPVLATIVTVAAFYLLALLVRTLALRLAKGAALLTQAQAEDVFYRDLGKPIFTTVFFFGLCLGTILLDLPAGTSLIVNLFLSVIVVSWMRASMRLADRLLSVLSATRRYSVVEPRTLPLFELTGKLLTILIGSYILLEVWGINPVGWLASAGIVGIAVGFAAKDTLGNLFSGFFIVADAPYQIGDYIYLDTGERGKVSAIGLRSTRLMTRDDVEITIPNGVIAAAKIVNESGGPSSSMRIGIPVGVAYGSDVGRVSELLTEIGEAHPETCQDPAPRARMRGFGPSSLDFELLCWIEHPEDTGRITHELLMEVYRALGREQIEIPYAKQDVFIKEMPGVRGEKGATHTPDE